MVVGSIEDRAIPNQHCSVPKKYKMSNKHAVVLKSIIKAKISIKPAKVRAIMMKILGWNEDTVTPSFPSPDRVLSITESDVRRFLSDVTQGAVQKELVSKINK